MSDNKAIDRVFARKAWNSGRFMSRASLRLIQTCLRAGEPYRNTPRIRNAFRIRSRRSQQWTTLFLFSLLPMLEFPASTLPTKNPYLLQDTVLYGIVTRLHTPQGF